MASNSSSKGKILILALIVVIVALAGAAAVGVFVLPGQRLQAADDLVRRGAYAQAVEAYQALSEESLLGVSLGELPFGPAHDAQERIPQTQYRYAEALLEVGSYDKASAQFKALGDYENAQERIGEPFYIQGETLLTSGEYAQAADAFLKAGDYRDAAQRIGEAWYRQAEDLLAEGQYEWASDAFFAAGDYKDAQERIDEPFYIQGEALLDQQQYTEAAAAFTRAGRYQDAVHASAYCEAQALLTEGRYLEAAEKLLAAGDYRDAQALVEPTRQKAAEQADRNAVLAPYITLGNLVTLGSYEQDGDRDNGKEPLVWRVLEAGEGYSVLATEKIIAMQPYMDNFILVTWENTSLRTWLLDTFLPGAFTSQERSMITSLPQILQASSRHGVLFDATSADLVTMLTEEQVSKLLPDGAAAAQATAYAIQQGVEAQDDGYARYWLCMPDYDADDAMVVGADGLISSKGLAVNTEGIGVRPVIYLNHDAIQ